jgi:protein CWC15
MGKMQSAPWTVLFIFVLELTLTNSGNRSGGEEGGGDDDDDDDEEDEEDDTAELLRELEKIKRERAAEQARLDQVEAEATEAEREAQIATANPLLNLAAALGNTPGINTTAPGTFAVKRRWDDGPYLFCHTDKKIGLFYTPIDLVFKNQAVGDKDRPQGQFVNDLLRTEFHR